MLSSPTAPARLAAALRLTSSRKCSQDSVIVAAVPQVVGWRRRWSVAETSRSMAGTSNVGTWHVNQRHMYGDSPHVAQKLRQQGVHIRCRDAALAEADDDAQVVGWAGLHR